MLYQRTRHKKRDNNKWQANKKLYAKAFLTAPHSQKALQSKLCVIIKMILRLQCIAFLASYLFLAQS